MRRLTDLVGLAGTMAFATVSVSVALLLLEGGDPFPGWPDWVSDHQKWLLPVRHPLRAGNRSLAPRISRGARNAFRLVAVALMGFWLTTNCLYVLCAVRAINIAQLKPVSARMNRLDL